MNVDLIFKIAAVGILIAVINMVLQKAGREEIAMMATLAGIVIVLLMVINLINQLFQNVKSIFKLY
ncbi:MAG: stage III sporulation protein AC [Caldicoprobacterales bacterium]|jgi:stage III sporulation protein AC|nr:stage III sporulation protein AC [Clostridiales bacterium]